MFSCALDCVVSSTGIKKNVPYRKTNEPPLAVVMTTIGFSYLHDRLPKIQHDVAINRAYVMLLES